MERITEVKPGHGRHPAMDAGTAAAGWRSLKGSETAGQETGILPAQVQETAWRSALAT